MTPTRFSKEKIRCLSRADNSRKGSIDKHVLLLVELLNSNDDYYTTSSCSGRIMLLVPAKTKKDTKWLFVSHEPVALKQVQHALQGELPRQEVWLRQEALILHVCCMELEHAARLIQASKEAGFKRSGIIALGKRIIVEIVGTSHFETIVATGGKILATRELLAALVASANQRLEKNFASIRKFETAVRKMEK